METQEGLINGLFQGQSVFHGLERITPGVFGRLIDVLVENLASAADLIVHEEGRVLPFLGQILFEKPLPTYFPGEIVNGTLIVNLSCEKKMQCIKVTA